MERRRRIKLFQISLLLLGTLIIYFTYIVRERNIDESSISKEIKQKIKKQSSESLGNGDIFYNIKYSGLDLAGNRYVLTSKEARNSQTNKELIDMKFVNAKFYFKDGTELNVFSDTGVYNNNTLDMTFKLNVKALYMGSQLYAQRAEYSNSKSYIIISESVKLKDIKGTMFADKLLFDIKKQTLNITSYDEKKVNANINLK
jgi:hypothetical protein